MNSSAHQQEQTEQSLSSGEAQLRLARDGYNELPSAIRRDTLAIALSVAREPMFLLLIASAVVYFVLGDVRESSVLSLSVVIIFAITIFQERKTERALDALRDLSSPRALVLRDGQEQRVGGRDRYSVDCLGRFAPGPRERCHGKNVDLYEFGSRPIRLDYRQSLLVAKSLANTALEQYGVLLGNGGCDGAFSRDSVPAVFARYFSLRVIIAGGSGLRDRCGIRNAGFAGDHQALLDWVMNLERASLRGPD